MALQEGVGPFKPGKKGANVLEKCLSNLYQYNDGIKKSSTQFPLNDFSQVKYLVGV